MSSTPYLVGSNHGGGSTTLVISVTGITNAGDAIVVGTTPSTGTVSGVTDTKGNTYTLTKSDTGATRTYCFTASGATTALTLTDAITITYSVANSASAAAVGIPGLTSSPVDVAVSADNNTGSGTPSVTSGTLAQSVEVAIAIEGNAHSGGAVSWGGTWTPLATVTQGTGPYVSMAYQTTSGTSPVTASGTITSAVWCMVLVTYEVSGGLAPYLAGSAAAASGGSVSLPVPLSAPTNLGDTVLVGVLSTSAGVTPSVSDTVGNNYAQILSDTTETGAQLYVFESDGSNPIPRGTGGGTSGTPGPVGATLNTEVFPGGTTADQAITDWHTVTGTTVGVQKWFDSNSSYPTTPDARLQSCIDNGIPAVLCYKPAFNPPKASDTTAMINSIQAFITAGLVGPYYVVLQSEPNAPSKNISASQLTALYKFHYAGLHAAFSSVNFQLWICLSTGNPSAWNSYYPGKAACDGVAIDYYATAYGSGLRLDNFAAQTADADGLPFGIFEMGITATGTVPSSGTFTNYLNYLQTFFTGRLTAGKNNGPVIWYNVPGPLWPQPVSADGVIVPLGVSPVSYANNIAQSLWAPFVSAITTAPTSGAPVTVTYSTNASAQAAIVVGVSAVSGADQKLIAHGSSAAPSSGASGTLSASSEQLVSFLADTAAGAAPAWTAPWSALTHIEAGTVAFLSAAQKTVSSSSPVTASGTITSAPWTIALVTAAQTAPTVTTVMSNGVAGESYSQTLQATGGAPGTSPPYTWSESGTLPPGLTLTAGVISGTPTTPGTYSFSISATDSHGAVGTLAQTVTIVAVTTGGAPAMTLNNNLLPVFDSDFETSGFTWAANLNVAGGSIARSTAVALDGTESLRWQAASPGVTAIASGPYPATALAPYIASAFIMPTGQGSVQVGIQWLDNTQTFIRTDWGPLSPPGALQWQPCSGAFTAPANAAYFQLCAANSAANASDATYLDLAYVAQADTQVLIDWVNPTFSQIGNAGQSFMDVSSFVRMDIGVSTGRGRQDAISEIQPGSASFTLQNDLGQFTRQSSTSLPAASGGTVSIGCRCQINFADENGAWHTRFDGPLAQILYAFDPTGNTSQASVTVTDVLSYLNRADALFCWTKQQVLTDKPLLHWSLDDSGSAGGTGVAAETSGNNGPAMRLVSSDSTKVAAIAWQDTAGGVETLADAVSATAPDGSSFWPAGSTQPSSALRGLVSGNVGPYTTPIGSVYLTPVQTAQSAQNTFVGNTGYMLEAELANPIAPTATGNDYSFEIWFTMDPSIATHLTSDFGPYVAFGLGSSRTYTNMVTGLFLNAGALKVESASYSQPPAFKGLNWPGSAAPTATASTSQAISADTIKVPHHLVVTVQGSSTAATVTLYFDGVSVGTYTLPKGQTYDTVTVGGAYGGCGAWFGNLSLMSVYPSALSQQQITLHAQLGQYGMWESLGDDAIAQIASYANIPPFWSNVVAQHFGLSMTDYMDITGSNGISAMQRYEQAEGGLLFVDATGALNIHTRDWRMAYGPPDLFLPPDSFDAGLGYQLVDQFMQNEMGVSGPNTLGATAVKTLTNTTTGATTTQTSSQTLVQGGFVNTVSQNSYGVYSSNPLSSPLSLPLVSWSRAFAALGIASLSYWADPNLYDRAAWVANTRADPWLIPGALTVDLLTLDPNTGLDVSDFYNLEIDSMVAPSGPLPESFPTGTAPVEWFIEGINETRSTTARTIQFYTSPASAQRAWIPGDPVYGVLGQTARVGISAPDVSTPQADGKSVSHDAGPPFWPPTFASNMNNPAGQGGAFIGAGDMRGLVDSLQLTLQPPMCSVSAISQTQSFTNGSLSNPALNWDTINVDTAGGMGLIPGWPNWYVCVVPGFYELSGSVVWATTGGGLAGYTGQAWFAIAQSAAKALAAGTGTPLTVGAYVCPVGEATRFNGSNASPVCTGTTRVYLGLGDMVALCAEQNFTSAHATEASPLGSQMSIRFVGLATADDRVQINSLISSGGLVTTTPPSTPGTFTYVNQHTYSYQGRTGFSPYALRNADSHCYQGVNGSRDEEGSQVSQVVFDSALMISQLSGKTITSATLEGSNQLTWYKTGTYLMVGHTTVTPGGASYNLDPAHTATNVLHQAFRRGQTLTFALPVALVAEFVTTSKAFVFGDGLTTNLDYYGRWQGGPGSWILTVNTK